MSSQTYRYYGLDGVGHPHLAEWFDAENDEKAVGLIEQLHPDERCEIWQGARLVAKLSGLGRIENVRNRSKADLSR
jgi:hypothetical protein